MFKENFWWLCICGVIAAVSSPGLFILIIIFAIAMLILDFRKPVKRNLADEFLNGKISSKELNRLIEQNEKKK